jgi:hypothetical protein
MLPRRLSDWGSGCYRSGVPDLGVKTFGYGDGMQHKACGGRAKVGFLLWIFAAFLESSLH